MDFLSTMADAAGHLAQTVMPAKLKLTFKSGSRTSVESGSSVLLQQARGAGAEPELVPSRGSGLLIHPSWAAATSARAQAAPEILSASAIFAAGPLPLGSPTSQPQLDHYDNALPPAGPFEPVAGGKEMMVRSIYELWGGKRGRRFDQQSSAEQEEHQHSQAAGAISEAGASFDGAGMRSPVSSSASHAHLKVHGSQHLNPNPSPSHGYANEQGSGRAHKGRGLSVASADSAQTQAHDGQRKRRRVGKTNGKPEDDSTDDENHPAMDSDSENDEDEDEDESGGKGKAVPMPPLLIKKGTVRPPWGDVDRAKSRWLFSDLESGLHRLSLGKLEPEAVVAIPSPAQNGWEGMTLLMVIAYEGGPEAVQRARRVILAGGNVNARNETDGISPLHYASQRGCADLVRYLIGNQDGYIMNQDGKTRISPAANVNARDFDGWTPLHYCTLKLDGERRGSETQLLQCLKALLSAGADVHARTRERKNRLGRTVLHLCAEESLARCVKAVVEHDCGSIHDVDRLGNTALLFAAFEGSAPTVKLLLDAGADVSTRGENGWSALHNAAASNCADVVERLIKAGAEVNGPDAEGSTPLHVACSNLSHITVKKLLDSGAVVNIKDSQGRVPLHDLCSQAVQDSAGDQAAALQALRWLIRAGADLDATDSQGRTALHMAADSCLHLLLKDMTSRHGAGTALWSPTGDQATAPAGAGTGAGQARAGTKSKASRAADVDRPDNAGWTALHYAAARGSRACITTLLSRNAVDRLKTLNGKTPRDVALEYNAGEEGKEVAALFDGKHAGSG